ncbi:trypsin alpha-like [Episyrphus balteatus]|uniref:trypsin alpha-like n=1 Tax=Episyrphus balteatus TaxID=286459 RepID=UPI0024867E94|nr:trypsin alpha-like [Episyrphus balteatus]
MMYFAGVIFLVAIVFPQNNAFEIENRIVGGNTASIENSNYQVSIRENGQHTCGGAILDANTILTAAHCTEGVKAAILSVSNGATIANNGIIHKVSKIIQHPNYNGKTTENDICLLKITPPIIFTNKSRPIKCATKRLEPGTNVKMTGWGKMSENDKETDLGKKSLRYVIVQVINQTVCSDQYKNLGLEIGSKRMCASALGKDSCQGDSGGPLVTGTGADRRVVGVCSVGYGCANKKYAGVYTFVPAFFDDFIKKYL